MQFIVCPNDAALWKMAKDTGVLLSLKLVESFCENTWQYIFFLMGVI